MMPALLMTTTASRLSSTDNSSAAPSAISNPSPLTPASSAAAACAQPRMRANNGVGAHRHGMATALSARLTVPAAKHGRDAFATRA